MLIQPPAINLLKIQWPYYLSKNTKNSVLHMVQQQLFNLLWIRPGEAFRLISQESEGVKKKSEF